MSCTIKFAAFVAFDELMLKMNAPLGSAVSVILKDDNGGERVIPCSDTKGKTEITVKLDGKIVPSAVYTAIVVDVESSSVSGEVRVRKFKLYDTEEFIENYCYDGELGVKYAVDKSVFAVWSPFASAVTLNIYDSGDIKDTVRVERAMKKSDKGVWTKTVKGDLAGKYYTFSAVIDGEVRESIDPYAVAAGRNGERGMVVDLAETEPSCGDITVPPAPFSKFVIYEAQLRDLTIDKSSDVSEANRGKYLGMTETGTDDAPTPLDRIKKLGVTAVHFQPLFDFASVDENFKTATFDKSGEYNWGYDPKNYNVPEGSYSSDPDDGAVRIKELKSMIAALHKAGIKVILDVVYNHVYDAATSCFQAFAPYYYFRTDGEGRLLNGSGCGNETASDRFMFRKYMIDSTSYWVREYKVDGLRFDLMALHDVDTMNAVCEELKRINPDIVVYGEGWDAGSNGLPPEMRACKSNAHKIKDVAFFDDIVRDGLRGSVFDVGDVGFVSGKPNAESAVFVSAAGGTDVLDDAHYKALGGDKHAFCASPSQNINYVAVHDNSTLWDKLNASVRADVDTLEAMNRLAAVCVMTGQGASLILAGEERCRSKRTPRDNTFDNHPHPYASDRDYWFADNSYRSPDSVNAIVWNGHDGMFDFYRGLIGIKRSFPQFGISDGETLQKCLHFGPCADGLAVFAVRDPEGSEFAVVAVNASRQAKRIAVPKGKYCVFVNGARAVFEREAPLAVFSGDTVIVPPLSALVMTAVLDEREVERWSSDACRTFERDLSAAAEMGISLPEKVIL